MEEKKNEEEEVVDEWWRWLATTIPLSFHVSSNSGYAAKTSGSITKSTEIFEDYLL